MVRGGGYISDSARLVSLIQKDTHSQLLDCFYYRRYRCTEALLRICNQEISSKGAVARATEAERIGRGHQFCLRAGRAVNDWSHAAGGVARAVTAVSVPHGRAVDTELGLRYILRPQRAARPGEDVRAVHGTGEDARSPTVLARVVQDIVKHNSLPVNCVISVRY